VQQRRLAHVHVPQQHDLPVGLPHLPCAQGAAEPAQRPDRSNPGLAGPRTLVNPTGPAGAQSRCTRPRGQEQGTQHRALPGEGPRPRAPPPPRPSATTPPLSCHAPFVLPRPLADLAVARVAQILFAGGGLAPCEVREKGKGRSPQPGAAPGLKMKVQKRLPPLPLHTRVQGARGSGTGDRE
jgi:hypothetical protein